MTETEYRKIDAISKTALWEIHKTPAHFRYLMEHPLKATPAMLFGRAAHKYALEPDTFDEEFAVAPVCDRRTKEGKAIWESFAADLWEREAVSAADMEIIQAMRFELERNVFAMALLRGLKEVPLFWADALTGEPCKGRLDAIIDSPIHAIADYKTCEDASNEAFMRSAIKYGYDLQAAMYTAGARANFGVDYKFIFIAQEKSPPYAVNVLEADPAFVERGARVLSELMDRYHTCKQSGIWWGYEGPDNIINPLTVPAWAVIE